MVDNKLSSIRREYGDLSLNEAQLNVSPIEQFRQWYLEISAVVDVSRSDPTAMVLSTVDEHGAPDSRVVLLKGLNEDGAFIFYTNYNSSKSKQLEHNSKAALNFYWPHMARQVRIRGHVERISADKSDAYFSSRPRLNQISAIVSPQSEVIDSREVLIKRIELLQQSQDPKAPIKRPDYWGGYAMLSQEIEFWQGRDNRLHDRILYIKKADQWVYCRLAP